MAKEKSEIETLRSTAKDLDGLQPEERERVLEYLARKYGFDLMKTAEKK